MTTKELDKLIDQAATVSGVARDARMGAVVFLDDRTPVYVAGLEEWDGKTSGKPINATGTLRRRKLLPDPVTDARGGISDGIEGQSYVLENASWQLAG